MLLRGGVLEGEGRSGWGRGSSLRGKGWLDILLGREVGKLLLLLLLLLRLLLPLRLS